MRAKYARENYRMPTTCVIFDIDGTLVDSGGFEDVLYTAAVRDVFGNVRLRADWGDNEHVTDAGIMLEICRENGLEIEDGAQKLRARFGELMGTYIRAMGPCAATLGALTLWNKLRDNTDVQLGIATGGWGHTARMKLESAGFVFTEIPLVSSDDDHIRMGIMNRCRECSRQRSRPLTLAMVSGTKSRLNGSGGASSA